jgi:hypothetical protein
MPRQWAARARQISDNQSACVVNCTRVSCATKARKLTSVCHCNVELGKSKLRARWSSRKRRDHRTNHRRRRQTANGRCKTCGDRHRTAHTCWHSRPSDPHRGWSVATASRRGQHEGTALPWRTAVPREVRRPKRPRRHCHVGCLRRGGHARCRPPAAVDGSHVRVWVGDG